MQRAWQIVPLALRYHAAVIALGNQVHGDNYLWPRALVKMARKGHSRGINANLVALADDALIGFRLTYAPGNWQPDRWCSVTEWGIPVEQLCYFKCNTVAEGWRGSGLGGELLRRSIDAVQRQGARAGITHIWMQSPGNAAYRYFVKAGGTLVKIHPRRWNEACHSDGYVCVRCGSDCHCDAGEMILRFP